MSNYTFSRGIETKFLAPTTHRGGRIKARTVNGDSSVTIPFKSAMEATDNHRAAADELAAKLEWDVGHWVVINTRGGGMTWVVADDLLARPA